MKRCKDVVNATSSTKTTFNTLYEQYIALVKKRKDLYYVNIIKLYVILVLRILLLYIELLPVGRDNHCTMPTTRSTVVHRPPLEKPFLAV